MKAQVLFVFLLLVSVHSRAQAPTNGLVVYYPFTGNANDASGNNRHGIVEGGASLTTDRLGNANQAYAFNGSNGDIITTYANWSILNGNAARSISVWFKTTLPTQYPQYMVSWGSYDTNLGSYVGTYTTGNNATKYLGFFTTDANGLSIADAFQYYDSRWHLLTFTHDGSTMRLYLDGALQSSATNVTLNTSITGLAIGRFTTGPYYFAGSLDEVRVYNRALTDTEIQQMYQAEAPVPPLTEFAKIGSNRFIHTIGEYNTSMGNMAGNSLTNGAGAQNTFMGYQTGRDNSTGSANTLLGYRAGYINTTGSQNTLLGNEVGASLTGSSNTMVGHQAGKSTSTGINNTFIGAQAGFNNTTGSNNIIIGPSSGTNITTGNDNILMGYNSRAGDGRGKHNLIIGGESGGGQWSGGSNTLIGYRASAKAPNLENATAIGADARVTISNAVVLGNNANVGIGTSAPTARLEVVGEKNNASGLRLTHLTAASLPTQSTDQFLTVNEKGDVVKAKYQLRINSANEWSDKVFAPGYNLQSLAEVKKYIDANQHLPGMPSAEQVAKEGVDLVRMNATLLEKVEELTLYSIQQDKTIQQQSQQINHQNRLLQQLEVRLQALEKGKK